MSSAVRTATREMLATAVRRNTNRTSSSSSLLHAKYSLTALLYFSLSLSRYLQHSLRTRENVAAIRRRFQVH